jgi:hypothetical protein
VNKIDLKLILTATCSEASRLASESLDRELTLSERWALRFHTAVCGNCRRFLRQLRTIRDAIAKMPNALRNTLHGWVVQLSPERGQQIKRLLVAATEDDRA